MNLEKIISKKTIKNIQEKIEIDKFLLYTVNNSIGYSKEIKGKLKDNLYDLKEACNLYINLYRKKLMPFRI